MNVRKILVALTAAVFVGCQPADQPPVTSSSSIAQTSSTTTATTTSTAPPTSTTAPPNQTVLRPSGGDDTALFVAAVAAYPEVVVDGPLRIDSPAVVTATNRTIRFTPRGSLRRTSRPEAVTWQVLVLKNSSAITIDNLRVEGPNIEVCNFWWTPPAPYQDQARFINVGYNTKYESQHGLEIRGGSDITVNGGRIYGVSGDGIYLDGQPTRVRIDRVSTECTGRSSISNVGSSDVTVTNSSLHRAGMWILNVEPFNRRYVHNYSVTATKVGYSNLTWLFASGPYFSCDILNVRIQVAVTNTGLDLPTSTRAPTINPCVANQFSVNAS